MSRILFLDIDGVVNPIPQHSLLRMDFRLASRLAKEKHNADFHQVSYQALASAYYCWNPRSLLLLKELCDTFQLQIVISSSWGLFYSLKELKLLFSLYDLDDRIHAIVSYIGKRSTNILRYVQEHPSIEAWITLDDLNMEEDFPDHAITTHGFLKEADAEKAQMLLQRQLISN